MASCSASPAQAPTRWQVARGRADFGHTHWYSNSDGMFVTASSVGPSPRQEMPYEEGLMVPHTHPASFYGKLST
jgi:hypothetical protein